MEEDDVTEALRAMKADPNLVTKSAYRANVELWPNHRISFVDSHLVYLKAHPLVDPRHYLSNLKLMIRKRP